MHGCCDRSFLKFLRERGDFRRRDFLAMFGAALAAGCSSSGGTISAVPIAPAQVTLLVNGNVLTLTKNMHKATAVAIGGTKILAVAATAGELEARYPQARIVDLHGATLTPGFVEAHAHVSQAALNAFSHDVSKYKTRDGFLDGLQKIVGATPPHEWIFCQGVDSSLLRPPGPPTFAKLNSVAPENPIFIEDSTGHLYYVNQHALNKAGVTPGQRFPGGGLIGGDHDGLEGIVYEFATGPFFAHAPKVGPAKLQKAIFDILRTAQRNGCTTWHDPAAGLFTGHLDDDLKIYQAIASSPQLPLRLMSSIILTDLHHVPSVMNRPRPRKGDGIFLNSDETLWIPSLKIWVDGTPQGSTAYMTDDYRFHPTGFPRGRLDWHTAKLSEHVGFAKEKGWSILMHTNGDAAIDQALQVVGDVFGPRIGDAYRVRFEHCTVSRSEQFETMKALGITPTFLNNHTYIWGDVFDELILGSERANRLDAAGDAVKHGMIFSFHCDWGVSQPEPLRYMQTAVTRKTKSGKTLGADLAISPLEALKGCTIYPAIQLGFDSRIGTIEPGKDADLVELGADPLTYGDERIASIPVIATWKMGTRIPA